MAKNIVCNNALFLSAIFSLLILLALPCAAASPPEILYGYVDHSGKWVIPPRYAHAFRFYYGRALVIDDSNRELFLDKSGKQVARESADGITIARNDRGQLIFVDKTGKQIGPSYYELGGFDPDTGLAYASLPATNPSLHHFSDKTGYVDRKGHIIIPLQYDSAGTFSEGLAVVSHTVPFSYWLFFTGHTDKYEVIDPTGKIVIPSEKIPGVIVNGFSEGLCVVDEKGEERYMDKTGAFAMGKAVFGIGGPFQEGLAYAVKAGPVDFSVPMYFGFIDHTGKWVIKPKFTKVSNFCEGLARVQLEQFEKPFGYIDKTGKFVIPLKYKEAGDFKEGLAAVLESKSGSDEWKYITKQGKTAFSIPHAHSAGIFSEGLAPVGIVNPQAKPSKPPAH